jgi:hypothetical protein
LTADARRTANRRHDEGEASAVLGRARCRKRRGQSQVIVSPERSGRVFAAARRTQAVAPTATVPKKGEIKARHRLLGIGRVRVRQAPQGHHSGENCTKQRKHVLPHGRRYIEPPREIERHGITCPGGRDDEEEHDGYVDHRRLRFLEPDPPGNQREGSGDQADDDRPEMTRAGVVGSKAGSNADNLCGESEYVAWAESTLLY